MAPLTDISRAFGQQTASSPEPISRTMQYRKVTKPLLERQRRARINRCLDELKEVLISGLQNETENSSVARLEKADILELTVRHLQKLQKQHNQLKSQQVQGDDERFRNGFAHCAQEVSRVLATTPGVGIQFGSKIMVHLGHSLNQITSPSSSPAPSPRRPDSVCSQASSEGYRPYTPPASPTESHFPQLSPVPLNMTSSAMNKSMWRPW